MNIPYLSADDLTGLGITTDQVIASIEQVIQGAADGRVWAAPKAVITTDDNRYMMAALAAMDGPAHLVVKTVVLNPDNSNHGLPQINGFVTMLDSKTGLPAAILDGNWITAVRTAGLSAVAAKYMARPDAQVVGFIGTGVQARSHLALFADMFPLHTVKFSGRGQANKDLLTAQAHDLGLKVQDCDANDIVETSDILVTSITHTAGVAPFVNADTMPPGSFAAAVDLAGIWHKESFAMLDQITVDDVTQEAAMPSKLCPPSAITGDLSQLSLGQVTGRVNESDRNAFVFRGHALGDLALASLALQKYLGTAP